MKSPHYMGSVTDRIDKLDWERIRKELHNMGFAVVKKETWGESAA
jgi:predicted methyltransferase